MSSPYYPPPHQQQQHHPHPAHGPQHRSLYDAGRPHDHRAAPPPPAGDCYAPREEDRTAYHPDASKTDGTATTATASTSSGRRSEVGAGRGRDVRLADLELTREEDRGGGAAGDGGSEVSGGSAAVSDVIFRHGTGLVNRVTSMGMHVDGSLELEVFEESDPVTPPPVPAPIVTAPRASRASTPSATERDGVPSNLVMPSAHSSRGPSPLPRTSSADRPAPSPVPPPRPPAAPAARTPTPPPPSQQRRAAAPVTPELLVDALSGQEEGLLAIAERLMEHYGDGYDVMGEAIIDAFADVQKLFQHVVEAAHMEGAAFEASRRDLEREEPGAAAPRAPDPGEGQEEATHAVRHEEIIDADVREVLRDVIASGAGLREAGRHMECYERYEGACASASALLPVDSDHRGRLQLSIARAESMQPERACAILRYAMDDVLRSGLSIHHRPLPDQKLRNDYRQPLPATTARARPDDRRDWDGAVPVPPAGSFDRSRVSSDQHQYSPAGASSSLLFSPHLSKRVLAEGIRVDPAASALADHRSPGDGAAPSPPEEEAEEAGASGARQSEEEALASLVEEMKEVLAAPAYEHTPLQTIARRFWNTLGDVQIAGGRKEERLEQSLAVLKGEFLMAKAEWEEKLSECLIENKNLRTRYSSLQRRAQEHDAAARATPSRTFPPEPCTARRYRAGVSPPRAREDEESGVTGLGSGLVETARSFVGTLSCIGAEGPREPVRREGVSQSPTLKSPPSVSSSGGGGRRQGGGTGPWGSPVGRGVRQRQGNEI